MRALFALVLVLVLVLDGVSPATAEERFFADRVLFPSGSATLPKQMIPVVAEVARRLRGSPTTTRLLLEGHTDTTGSELHNVQLGIRRSHAVKEMLMGMGVPAERLIPRTFASHWPVMTNLTEKGRQQNRRVEFVVAPPNFREDPPTSDAEPASSASDVRLHAVALRAIATFVGAAEGKRELLGAQDAVHAGERLETEQQGRAIIRLPGVVVARLGPDTALRVDGLTSAGDKSGFDSQVTLERGTVHLRAHYPLASSGGRVRLGALGGVMDLAHPAEARVTLRRGKLLLEALRGRVDWLRQDHRLALPAGHAVVIRGDSVETVAALPLPPRPLAPLRGTVRQVQLRWSPVATAAGYVVEVARDLAFLDTEVRHDVRATSTSADLEAGLWFWRVRSRDGRGRLSKPSTLHAFELKP